ncbi:hypothetical protein SAMN05216218_106138 [Halorientalis regularis]|uniref:Uncharacterized protein n=1 Tax=Halorientalis regularis TaxID=660518 RepID=A0A1G7L2R5_9EURY|nr:hypothetical protein SAMN05216218_106138 [Halorientalis regularis]
MTDVTTTTRTRRWLPRVDLTVFVPTVVLIAAEVSFLATQARSVLLPLIWMAPMNLLLLAYAVEESLALSMVALVLFFARFVYLPFLLLAPMSNFLLFYALFMAPVDVLIVGYMTSAAGTRVLGSSSAT